MRKKECAVVIREGRGSVALDGELKLVASEVSRQGCRLQASDTFFRSEVKLQLRENEAKEVKLAGRSYSLHCEALYLDAATSEWCARLTIQECGTKD